MKCEYFEENLSEYLDGVVEKKEAQIIETHAALCPACGQILRGVRQMRQTMQEWATESSSAHFQLELTNCLEEARRQSGEWVSRSLTLTLALVAALAILLWPEITPPDLATMERGQERMWTRITKLENPLAGSWQLGVSELAHSSSYSHAQVRPVSF